MNPKTVIVNGPYLVRSVDVRGSTLAIQADFNRTATVEVIGAPAGTHTLEINGKEVSYSKNRLGDWAAEPHVTFPDPQVPNLQALSWKGIDALPELQSEYDDSPWTEANHNYTDNSFAPLTTDVSLYASDYGYNTGSLLYRGHFTAMGGETELFLRTVGGLAFGTSAWINDNFLGSAGGDPDNSDANTTYKVPQLQAGTKYTLTVLVDNMGLNENLNPGYDSMKEPRGILEYSLTSANGSGTAIHPWRVTGNLGGEDYKDHVRGPLNEGGLYYERQGYHQPSPPLDKFQDASPFAGIPKAGIQYYTTKFSLDLPSDDYDIPLAFSFVNSTDSGRYRAFLYVNGFQFGKYVSYLGPQQDFPVPEGILNYSGENWIGLALWAMDDSGAKVPGLSLKAKQPVMTSRQHVELVDAPSYSPRHDAY